MTPEQFEQVVLNRCEKIQSVMASKNKEYATDQNKFHNFEKAGRIRNKTREDVMWGMALKHYVSIDDIVENVNSGKLPTKELLEEKITDMCNYLVLLEAMLLDRINQAKNDKDEILRAGSNDPMSDDNVKAYAKTYKEYHKL